MYSLRVFTVLKQLREQLLIQVGGLFFIQSCYGASRNSFRAKMIELFLLGFEIGLNISQTLPTGKLGHQYGNKLIQAGS